MNKTDTVAIYKGGCKNMTRSTFEGAFNDDGSTMSIKLN